MTLFSSFLECPSMLKCLKFISSLGETTNVTLEKELGPKKWNRWIRSLNKMQEWIIKVTTQFPDGSPIEPKSILSKWCNDCSVLAREKFKIIWSDRGVVPVKKKQALWELIKTYYVFPSEHEKLSKRATILIIRRAIRRFKHALDKFYVQPSV
jgi:hypothetical protein